MSGEAAATRRAVREALEEAVAQATLEAAQRQWRMGAGSDSAAAAERTETFLRALERSGFAVVRR